MGSLPSHGMSSGDTSGRGTSSRTPGTPCPLRHGGGGSEGSHAHSRGSWGDITEGLSALATNPPEEAQSLG